MIDKNHITTAFNGRTKGAPLMRDVRYMGIKEFFEILYSYVVVDSTGVFMGLQLNLAASDGVPHYRVIDSVCQWYNTVCAAMTVDTASAV